MDARWARFSIGTDCGLADLLWTTRDWLYAGSEAGLVDMDPAHIVHSGRLGPGQMIVADLDFNRFFENDEILRIYDTKRHYQDLIQLDTPLEIRRERRPPLDACGAESSAASLRLIRAKTCA